MNSRKFATWEDPHSLSPPSPLWAVQKPKKPDNNSKNKNTEWCSSSLRDVNSWCRARCCSFTRYVLDIYVFANPPRLMWCDGWLIRPLTRVQYQGSFQPHHSTSITIDWGSQLVTSVSSSSHIISTGPAFTYWSSYIPFPSTLVVTHLLYHEQLYFVFIIAGSPQALGPPLSIISYCVVATMVECGFTQHL